jgi:hypothetical protein
MYKHSPLPHCGSCSSTVPALPEIHLSRRQPVTFLERVDESKLHLIPTLL